MSGADVMRRERTGVLLIAHYITHGAGANKRLEGWKGRQDFILFARVRTGHLHLTRIRGLLCGLVFGTLISIPHSLIYIHLRGF